MTELSKSRIGARGDQPVDASFRTAESVSSIEASPATDHTIALADGVAKALFVAVGGDIKVDTPNGETITYTSVPAGFQPIACTKVYATGTTATGIIAGAW